MTTIRSIIQGFLGGMVIHFLIHTFVTYRLGLDGPMRDILWLWKEVFLLVGVIVAGIICARYYRVHGFSFFSSLPPALWWGVGLLVAFVGQMVISTVITDSSLRDFLVAFKYDVLGFGILIIAILIGLAYPLGKNLSIRYARLMKSILIIALIRRCILVVKPGTMTHLFGYHRTSVEGSIDAAPPVVYFTNLTNGYVRNQFLFERPIMRGFWLVAFFPLFFWVYLYRRRGSDVYRRYALYAINILVTFSRAAWLARAIILTICLCTQYRGLALFRSKKLLLRVGGLGILAIIGLLVIVPRHVWTRTYSTTGHIEMTKKGIEMYTTHPVRGAGPATAGPGSFQRGELSTDFNPENQFLQIFVEFGTLGGLIWLVLFAGLGLYRRCIPLIHLPRQKKWTDEHWQIVLLCAYGWGMIGLGLTGLVLHSFVDRMIVYPFMLLYGLVLGEYRRRQYHLGGTLYPIEESSS